MKSSFFSLQTPSKLLLALEMRALFEMFLMLAARPILGFSPKGDGHPIIVFPGFLAGDWATVFLRKFLKKKGYAVHGWKLGFNKGYSKELDTKLSARLTEIYQRYDRKVTLIGWSLGGIFARELAHVNPEMVRSVITLGSPFNNISEGIRVKKLYEIVSGHKSDNLPAKKIERLRTPPPVPTTSIFSCSDGIVAPGCCCGIKSNQSENIEVPAASHCGLASNPLVFWIIANRLAQKEESWQPLNSDMLLPLFNNRFV